MEDEDFFSDNDLEDLPDDTLRGLEQHAWSSTQRPSVAASSQSRKQAHNASSLNRSLSYNNLPWRPPQRSQAVRPGSAAAPTLTSNAVETTSFDEYGVDDEVVVDLNVTSAILNASNGAPDPRNGGHQTLFTSNAVRQGPKSPPDTQTEEAYAAADAQLADEPFSQTAGTRVPILSEADLPTLQARVAQLEAEQIRLRRAAQDARNATVAKQGEIAIVRSNFDKSHKDFERRIAVLQKQHAEEAARHKAEVDGRVKEVEKMRTDNRFLQHEVAQEADRVKRMNGVSKTRPAIASKETPRRSRKQHLGDGFDNEEVYHGSPSRSGGKAGERTPKAGAKRKRPAPESPTASLSASHSFAREASDMTPEQPEVVRLEELSGRNDGSNRVIQHVLTHAPFGSDTSTIEVLTQSFFPSSTHQSLSSMIVDEMTRSLHTDVSNLALNITRVLLRLWASCLDEKYLQPLPLLLSLLRSMLDRELSEFAFQLMEEAVPLCLRSMDLITVDITKAAAKPNYGQQVDWHAHEILSQQVDLDEVLDLLLAFSHACTLSPERIGSFWRSISGSFLLTMLSKALPISYITTTLKMLKTSVLASTFGPIRQDSEFQMQQEYGIVERLTHLLFEHPQQPKGEPNYSDEEITEFRIEVLLVLQQMCLADHGGTLIAHHRSALGRLIRFLEGQICRLYETRPSVGLVRMPGSDTPESSLHDLVVRSINLSMRVFYHVIRTYDSSIDIFEKLKAVLGGYHKFMVSMTRIAFSEQLVLEAGIEEEVIEAAHTILDNLLGPEDGDAIKRALETPRGTRGSSTEVDTSNEHQVEQDDEGMAMDGIG